MEGRGPARALRKLTAPISWQAKHVHGQEANAGDSGAGYVPRLWCEPELHCPPMAKKTVVLPRPSDTAVPAPIVAEDSRWIVAVGKDRYAVDFHATARRLKQAPAKVVPIQSRLGSLFA